MKSKSEKVLVIAPHPDDETFGCGGSLLRHKYEGNEIFWLIITKMKEEHGWRKELIKKRPSEIEQVSKSYCFSDVINLDYPSTRISSSDIPSLVENIGSVIKKIKPSVIYAPFPRDVHTDHQYITNAVQSTIKWFRHPSINLFLVYETLSETNFNFLTNDTFKPNYFVNISPFFKKKMEIVKIYKSEIKAHPFPRSTKSIKSLATLRGSQSGYEFAEAFHLLYFKK
tara:strand:+ start:13187 stop:13864 length:678 start_codon:yes stop_codon:yes gene_type:complete